MQDLPGGGQLVFEFRRVECRVAACAHDRATRLIGGGGWGLVPPGKNLNGAICSKNIHFLNKNNDKL